MDTIPGILRDVLVIGYLFVLRIGVPLLIMLMVGMWLRKVLEPKPAPEKPEAEKGVVRS
jgi:hypothetical protein